MTPTEHLQLIKAECERLLAIAEKRTQREWELNTHPSPSQNRDAVISEHGGKICEGLNWNPNGENDGQYIAACAGRAEAGWRSTVAAIDKLAFDQSGNAATIEIILSAWPIELLTQ
jgi:hypothetical protein